MIRLAIIEDEELARKRVKRLLATHEDIELIGEATTGSSGLDLIRNGHPDVVLLDIEMPELSGFELLQYNLPKRPVIIFSTAYPNFALRAFDADAVDYLLKPYDQERFDQALEKARYAVREWRQKESSAFLTELEIVDKGVQHRISMERVIYLEAFGNYLKLHTPVGYFLHRSAMSKIEGQLDSRSFIRIHRSYIVNTRYIAAIKYVTKGEYLVHLHGGPQVSSGRKYQNRIQDYLKVEV